MSDISSDEYEQRMYGTETIRFAMIGMTGAGKSATGNMIAALDERTLKSVETAKKKGSEFFGDRKKNWNKLVGQPSGKPFLSMADSQSVTQEPSRKDFVLFGQKLAIVDTPGFVDTKCSEEKIVEHILASLYMLTPGPHAIIMIVNAGRQTPEVTNTIKRMKEIFGPDIVNFLIIVFTRMDDVIRDGGDIDEFVTKLKTTSTVIGQLLKETGDRYVGFNNALMNPFSEDNTEQVQKLIEMAKGIAERNNGRCYSNALLKETYKRLRDAELLELRVEKEKEKAAHDLKLKEVQLRTARDYEKKLEKQHDQLMKLLKEAMNKPAPAPAPQAPKPIIVNHRPSGGCFAATSTVITRDTNGQECQKALKDLDIGDLVESYDPNAKATVFSPVYFITYQDDEKTKSTLRCLYYEDMDGKVQFLAIHPKHLVYANVKSMPEAKDLITEYEVPVDPVMSEAVKEGDILWFKDASSDQLKPAKVLMADKVSTNVRHPLTFNHFIVVDGVLASVHMYDECLLRCVTTPLRLTYKMNPSFNKSTFTRKMVKFWDTVENHL